MVPSSWSGRNSPAWRRRMSTLPSPRTGLRSARRRTAPGRRRTRTTSTASGPTRPSTACSASRRRSRSTSPPRRSRTASSRSEFRKRSRPRSRSPSRCRSSDAALDLSLSLFRSRFSTWVQVTPIRCEVPRRPRVRSAREETLNMAAGREKFLRVAEAKPADAGRGIVRIDPEVMKILELKEGDIVLIEGAKSTAAGVRHGYPEDANRGVIRMDGMQRRNAGVGIDDKVGLRNALARPDEKVTLAQSKMIRIIGGEQYMAQVLQGRAITRGDVISVSVMGRKFDFVVTSFSPGADAVLVEAETEIKIAEKPMKEEEAKVPKVDYEDIGGLGSEGRKVRGMIGLPLRHPAMFERLGVEAPKGVLLHGPPGTGKTLLAKAVASETKANFYSISGPQVMSKFYGQSQENLRGMLTQAGADAPSNPFIPESP